MMVDPTAPPPGASAADRAAFWRERADAAEFHFMVSGSAVSGGAAALRDCAELWAVLAGVTARGVASSAVLQALRQASEGAEAMLTGAERVESA
ncbi:hypothetical protein [Novosphingobium cyanobacteriorum]|uniref:Uncharacterized protein n=1 Tax=Novosphingobium cyanobacteriorum TaxID=3024215 RepID=A0ABT6CKV4_9SPHN|nr:hypothetical protein [Novosphingobium cyanobacteriorum]MDF8334193.1 hypothetical protein [Novosphingobium cyanobacteriorum]